MPTYEKVSLISQHKHVQLVRDCVEGETKIKSKGVKYLRHPSMIDSSSQEALFRYQLFLEGAEFDGQPNQTLRTLVGKLKLTNIVAQMNQKVEYLNEDSDGDGLTISGALEYASSNVMQAKYHVIVCDYQGLAGLDIDKVSAQDIEEANPRATIKHYVRESVVNYHFRSVNGKNQLAMICFKEVGSTFDESTFQHEQVESYLILALDENGDYYQQKVVKSGKNVDSVGERGYVVAGGKPLKFIPCVILCDEEIKVGSLPDAMGFLYPICSASLHKYRVSAVYKEAQRELRPTVNTSGWDEHNYDVFKNINGGRGYIITGGNNNLPEGVESQVFSSSGEMGDFHWYFENQDKKIMSMGGTVKQELSNMTATEAEINASEQNSMLTMLADNIEDGFRKAIWYCGIFEGVYSQDEMPEDIELSLPRDFATPKLSVEEVGKIYEGYTLGVYTVDQVVKMMVNGGWSHLDAEDHIKELEDYTPVMGVVSSASQEIEPQ